MAYIPQLEAGIGDYKPDTMRLSDPQCIPDLPFLIMAEIEINQAESQVAVLS